MCRLTELAAPALTLRKNNRQRDQQFPDFSSKFVHSTTVSRKQSQVARLHVVVVSGCANLALRNASARSSTK
jgi:hypothetical protein